MVGLYGQAGLAASQQLRRSKFWSGLRTLKALRSIALAARPTEAGGRGPRYRRMHDIESPGIHG